MTIAGGRTKQLDIFCRLTGLTNDFLSFMVVELIQFFHGAIQLLFYRRLLCSDNIVLRTLAGLIRFEMLGIAAKYDIKSMYFSTATIKYAVWSSFVNFCRF